MWLWGLTALVPTPISISKAVQLGLSKVTMAPVPAKNINAVVQRLNPSSPFGPLQAGKRNV
jgi:hypothetical protein